MKKYFSFIVAVATIFSVTSCSQDEVVGNEASRNEVEVSFNVGMEGQAVSRLIGDGETVDKVYFAVYDEAGNEISNLRQDDAHSNAETVSGLGATVTTHLVKGQTYQFVFWAQKSGVDHYNTSNMQAISVNYDNFSNDETRDAFYAHVKPIKVTGPFKMDVTLYRPFAQLNLATTAQDWEWAKTAGVEISHSEVTVEGAVFSTLNTFDGSVTGETKAVFTLNGIPAQSDMLKIGENKYYYLSTNYLLAPAEKDLSKEIVFTLKDEQENNTLKEINTLKVYNAPLQRNWRTNIVGNILTGEGTFNITIDPIPYDDRNYDMPGSELYIVENGTDLDAALNDPNVNVINFVTEIENIGLGYEINKDVVLNFNNHELNAGSDANSKWYAIQASGEHNVIINDANFTRAGIAALDGCNVVFNSGTINHNPERSSRYIFLAGNNSTVTIKDGTFINDRPSNSYFYAYGNSTIYVEGGNFGGSASTKKIVTASEGKVIITGGTFNFNPEPWLAAGYKAEKNGSTWTVSKQ